MAIQKKPSEQQQQSSSNEPSKDNPSGLADPTFKEGDQTVDPKQDKVLPSSDPEEIAPVPDAAGNVPAKAAPSSTGYRVAEGKSITSQNGDILDSGAEIGPAHLAGGQQRVDELVKSGHIDQVGKSGEELSGEQKPSEQQPHKSGEQKQPEQNQFTKTGEPEKK